MPYPTVYNVTYSYTGFQQSQGNNAFPGTQVDADLAGLQATTTSLSTFMKSVMRADGALNNGIVTFESLAASLQTAGLTPALPWASGVNYPLNGSAVINANLYRAAIAHTSGVFATDLAAGKWTFVTALAGSQFTQNGTGAAVRTVASKLQDSVSVKDFGAVGDGVADDAAAIQAAVNAAAGKSLLFPLGTYKINTNITKPSAGISVVVDSGVSFTGTGRMFPIDSNTFHDYVGTTLTMRKTDAGVAGRGYSALSSEFISDNNFVGNGCASFFGAKTPNNAVGFYWATNTVLELNPGLTGNGIANEIDLNNFGNAGKGQGLLITGVGTAVLQVGVAVQRGDTTSDWQFGQWIKNSQIGMLIDGANVASPGLGLEIFNYPNNLLKLKPLNDTTPSDTAAFLTNAGDSQVNWKLTKRGGMQLGNAGTEILRHLSVNVVLNFGAVGANSSAELTVTVTGAAQGDLCVASPNLALAAGFSWNAYCIAANTVTVRVTNSTTAAVDPDGGGANWRVDVWQH